MWGRAQIRFWIAALVVVSIGSTLLPPHALAQTPPVPPPPPAVTTTPAPPSNYAVPPPPAATSRYPAAPDLSAPTAGSADTSVTSVTSDPAAAPTLHIPSHIATRLRVISTDLNTLASRGNGGITDGVFSIITGGGLIALGVVFDSHPSWEFLAPQLYVFGAASIGRGLIDLIIVPNPYGMLLEYSHMPMTSVRLVKARLRYGEASLEELADRNRLARLVDGAVSVGAGATLAGLTFSANSRVNATVSDDNRNLLMVMGLVGAATLTVGGLISLLSSSDEERRWDAYQGLTASLEHDRALGPDHARRARATAVTTTWTPVINGELAMGILTVTY